MKDNSTINDIVIKAITDEQLTSTESAILDQWLADAENRALFENLRNKDYLLQKLIEAHEIDVEGDKGFLEQKLALGKRIEIKRKAWYRDVATAAAVILILTAAAFFWLNTRNTGGQEVSKEGIKTVAQTDIAPGSTTALLTLADGSKVVLDSTVAGQFAQQGETVILNEKGTLIYKENSPAQNELYNTLSTANGQTYKMVFADGSKVWLNAGASIRYPVSFTGNERMVQITGEAYFEVAHQATKPFFVHVSGQKGAAMDVQVLGTHFNINAYPDEDTVKTTLLEGSVKIKQGNSIALLKPAQQAQVSNDSIKVLSNVNMDAAIAWKNGRFNFDNADIDAVMRQLAKWYNIEVEYEGAKPTQLFMGEIERDLMLSQVLRVLKYTGLHGRIEGKKLIVMSSGPAQPQNNNTKQSK
jgi:ferric-dicitrate binding protein FerR (iron transport regulator)